MRRVSKKRAALNRSVKQARNEFAREMGFCALCRRPGSDVHEIARGGSRGEAIQHRCAWLFLCRMCHQERIPNWTVAQQLALKGIVDPHHYDRVAVNRLRHRADDAITEQEVWVEV